MRRYRSLPALAPDRLFALDVIEMRDGVAHDSDPGWNLLRQDGSVAYVRSDAVYSQIGTLYSDWTVPNYHAALFMLEEGL